MKFVSPSSGESDSPVVLDLDHLLSDARWEQLVDLLPDGLVLVDRTGFVRYINSAAESIIELLRIEAVGRPLQQLVKQSALDCDVLLEAFAEGLKINQIISARTRQPYVLSTRCVRDWNGEVTCFVIVLRDIEQLTKLQSDAPVGQCTAESDAASIAAGGGDGDESMVLCDATALLVERALKAMSLGSRLLLLGESGAGKTEFARLLHRRSGAASRPFIHVNCGSIPESLFESEMFGYERGSFTGALSKGKRGLVEAADGGILFLDEIGEIPLSSQGKMLQFLEENAIHRVGATHAKRLRVQIIAATNRDLREMVAAGTFRRDLYYRLSVVPLTLPPLRDCPNVVDRLIDRFVARVNRRRPSGLRFDAASRRRLVSYGYPGNVRELQNLVEHLAVVCDQVVLADDVDRALSELDNAGESPPRALPPALEPDTGSRLGPLKDVVRRYESHIVQDAIRRTGSKRKAAELLGVDIATIVRKSRPSAL
jgi:PAS domain S-box-containing protein